MEICNRLRLRTGRDLYGITGYKRKMNRSRKKQWMQILCCYRSRVRVFRFGKKIEKNLLRKARKKTILMEIYHDLNRQDKERRKDVFLLFPFLYIIFFHIVHLTYFICYFYLHIFHTFRGNICIKNYYLDARKWQVAVIIDKRM